MNAQTNSVYGAIEARLQTQYCDEDHAAFTNRLNLLRNDVLSLSYGSGRVKESADFVTSPITKTALGDISVDEPVRDLLEVPLDRGLLEKCAVGGAVLESSHPQFGLFLQLSQAGLLDMAADGAAGATHFRFTSSGNSFGTLSTRLMAQFGLRVSHMIDLPTGEGCPVKCVVGKYRTSGEGDSTQAGQGSDSEYLGVASGRGMSRADAALGCIAEGIERLCLERRGDEPVSFESHERLKAEAVSPSALQLFSRQQYETRATWNQRYPVEHHVPCPIESDRTLAWVKATPTLSTSASYVPLEHCMFAKDGAVAHGFPAPDSSGCSIGSDLEDAAVRGFLELVERDAVAIWWYGRIRRPPVTSDVWQNDDVSAIAEWCQAQSRRLVLLDLTTDLGIHVVAAITWDRDQSHVAMGFGAASCVVAAAKSALGEMVQFHMNLRLAEAAFNRRRPGALLSNPWHLLTWSRDANAGQLPFLHPDADVLGCPARRSGEISLAECHAICRAKNLDFLVVDRTHPDIAVPVVRVLVPGLRPIWPRFAPGRLYSVPVAQGWREADYSEGEVNPTPLLY